MRFSRACYDKPHRCPGWAGGGFKSVKVDRCENGSIRVRTNGFLNGYPGEHPWRFGHCIGQCGVVTWPWIARWLDPAWLKWAVVRWMPNADLIYWNEEDRWLLGEDQHGDWWVPYVPADMRPHWDRFSRRNPLHWLCYWNSRRRNEVVFLAWDAVEHDVADPMAWSNPEWV